MKKTAIYCLIALFFAGCGRSEKIQVRRTGADSVTISYDCYEGFFGSDLIVSVEYDVFLPNSFFYRSLEGQMRIYNYRTDTSAMISVTRDSVAQGNNCNMVSDELQQGYNPEVCRLVVAWRRKLNLDRRVSEILRSPPLLTDLNPPR